MPRTILVHLNVEVPDGDGRTANGIADNVLDAVHIAIESGDVDVLRADVALAEEV